MRRARSGAGIVVIVMQVLAMTFAAPGLRAVAAPREGGGPMTLAEQRRAAEEAGFTIVKAPDAPQEGEALPEPSEEAKKAGAAIFVRDYNLPIYPEGRVSAAELEAPTVVAAARGESEPLSLGVHALADLEELTLSVAPLSAADGTALPPEAVRVRYVEAAYIRGDKGEVKTAVLTSLRVRPLEPLPLARGMSRQFWIDVSVPESATAAEYQGEIIVRSEGRPAIQRELTVRVRPYVLQEPSDRFIGAFCANAIVPDRETFADWKAHGVEGMLWFWSSLPWRMKLEEGKLVCDFSRTENLIDDRVAEGLTGPVVIALGNDRNGFYEQHLCHLYDRPLAEKEPVHGRAARVAQLDDEVINQAYQEGIRQFDALVESKAEWPEVILLHYDEPTERLMPEAALRYRQIKEVAPEMRVYGVTMNRLRWAEQVAPICDILVCNGDFAEIAALAREKKKEAWGYSAVTAVAGFGGGRFSAGYRLYRYDLGSHWFWSYDFSVGDTWNEFDGFTGDANWVSVYPGRTWNQHVPTLAWESLREARDDHRYGATLEKLLAENPGARSDRIAAEYRRMLDELPPGRGPSAFPPDPDGAYPQLPSYHRLTEVRTQIAAWIEQLRPTP